MLGRWAMVMNLEHVRTKFVINHIPLLNGWQYHFESFIWKCITTLLTWVKFTPIEGKPSTFFSSNLLFLKEYHLEFFGTPSRTKMVKNLKFEIIICINCIYVSQFLANFPLNRFYCFQGVSNCQTPILQVPSFETPYLPHTTSNKDTQLVLAIKTSMTTF